LYIFTVTIFNCIVKIVKANAFALTLISYREGLMAELNAFLSKLAQDANLKTNYDKDPSGTMIAEGISAADRDAVLSGDRAKIAARLGTGGIEAFGISVNITVTLGIT
jgi:hypothetical protein